MLYPDYYPEKCPYAPEHFPHLELTQEQLNAFYDKVTEHISYVQEAGKSLGLTKDQLELHDYSKFSPQEYGAYAKHFHGGGAPQEFAAAWLHHIHSNKHHWQYWIFPDGYTPRSTNIEQGVVEMPFLYQVEMIADWIGAGKAYTGSEDMTDWLSKNIGRITLHSLTAASVSDLLRHLGYTDVVNEYGFRIRMNGELLYGS